MSWTRTLALTTCGLLLSGCGFTRDMWGSLPKQRLTTVDERVQVRIRAVNGDDRHWILHVETPAEAPTWMAQHHCLEVALPLAADRLHEPSRSLSFVSILSEVRAPAMPMDPGTAVVVTARVAPSAMAPAQRPMTWTMQGTVQAAPHLNSDMASVNLEVQQVELVLRQDSPNPERDAIDVGLRVVATPVTAAADAGGTILAFGAGAFLVPFFVLMFAAGC